MCRFFRSQTKASCLWHNNIQGMNQGQRKCKRRTLENSRQCQVRNLRCPCFKWKRDWARKLWSCTQGRKYLRCLIASYWYYSFHSWLKEKLLPVTATCKLLHGVVVDNAYAVEPIFFKAYRYGSKFFKVPNLLPFFAKVEGGTLVKSGTLYGPLWVTLDMFCVPFRYI